MNTKVTLIVILAVTLQAQAMADEPLRRLGDAAAVVQGATGLPKWRTNTSVRAIGEKGDSFMFTVDVRPNEMLTVGVYLFATQLRKADDGIGFETVGQETPVPASKIGAEWGYKSQSLGCAGAWVMLDNSGEFTTNTPVSIFLPYAIAGLRNGAYRFRYLVRVIDRKTGRAIDSFFAQFSYDAFVRPGQFRPTMSLTKTRFPLTEFGFEGVKDPEFVP
ncbi:MAG: hypothetical protein AAGG48_23340 [Planctomycetota bacterium]